MRMRVLIVLALAVATILDGYAAERPPAREHGVRILTFDAAAPRATVSVIGSLPRTPLLQALVETRNVVVERARAPVHTSRPFGEQPGLLLQSIEWLDEDVAANATSRFDDDLTQVAFEDDVKRSSDPEWTRSNVAMASDVIDQYLELENRIHDARSHATAGTLGALALAETVFLHGVKAEVEPLRHDLVSGNLAEASVMISVLRANTVLIARLTNASTAASDQAFVPLPAPTLRERAAIARAATERFAAPASEDTFSRGLQAEAVAFVQRVDACLEKGWPECAEMVLLGAEHDLRCLDGTAARARVAPAEVSEAARRARARANESAFEQVLLSFAWEEAKWGEDPDVPERRYLVAAADWLIASER